MNSNMALAKFSKLGLSATGSFEAYQSFASRQPILSESEEQELFERFRLHEDLDAAQTLVLSHLRFVAYVARSYTGYGLPIEDLAQEGTVGLMKSVKKFDPTRGVRFISYASHWIKAAILEYVLDNWKLVKQATTKSKRKLFFNLRKHKKHLGWLNRNETEGVARALGVDSDEVTEMECRLIQRDAEFSEGPCEDEDPQARLAAMDDPDANPESLVIEREFCDRTVREMKAFIEELDERARDILASRWLCENESRKTFKELAARYSISMERVRQIESASLVKLRDHMIHRAFQ